MQLRYISVGISFPPEILSKIDLERGDIPRSRYVLRQLEKVLHGQSLASPTNVGTQVPNGGKSNG